jgi:aspartyl-tRNA(Asn)/glutamyl-tRNA(Gln) amidotransferase subunit C
MTVTTEDIKRTSRLARLRIDETEIPVYAGHINNLLVLIDKMSAVNTDNIDSMSHPMENQIQRFREDIVTEENQRELFQQNSQNSAQGLYIVNKVIE